MISEERASPKRTLHTAIREDIVEGRITAGSRLVVADLAKRYGSSSNPVREALHQLQGEGFVTISLNRGARVRSLDEDFVRNVYDIRACIEPYLIRWFVANATAAEIDTMEEIQQRIEKLPHNFEDYRELNEAFHEVAYKRHFNREALDLEFRQREVLFMLNRRFPVSRSRWKSILCEHSSLVDAVKKNDPEAAAAVTEAHVRGACEHLLQHMRSARSLETS
jgi:DNA-binding GntR family transcriptional regulator